jgi:hypothetical protein
MPRSVGSLPEAIQPAHKDTWLKLAEHWLKLAQIAEAPPNYGAAK